MTVKCLNETDKAEMASLYAAKLCDTDDLAQAYGVSKRTVNRVMVEQGVNHVRHYKHRTPAGHGMPIDMFEPHDDSQDIQIPETAPTPDHLLPELTFMEKVKVLFKVIFTPNKNNNAQSRA